MQMGRFAAAPLRQLRHRRGGERGEVHANDVIAVHIPEREPDGMPLRELIVSIGDDEHRARALNASPDEPQEIERRFIGPVQIFEHHHRGALGLGEILEQRPVESVQRLVFACDTAARHQGL